MLPALDERYALPADAAGSFARDGFVVLRELASAAEVAVFRGAIAATAERLRWDMRPLEERDTYGKAFLQVTNLWQDSERVLEFVSSPRLARIAAQLLGVQSVRLYHDQALYKEPSGGVTPWHADQYYWPLSNANSCTAWIPLQATPPEMGPLAFSVGSHRFESGRDMEISDEGEQKISAALEAKNLPTDEEPFDLGEVSFHYGWTFHRAGPNTTTHPRAVMTVIYIEDGIRLVEPMNKNQIGDIDKWMAGTKVGDVVATELNPVLYRRDENRV